MPLPTAVADTSVLINLDHLHLLGHLSHLFQQILIPAKVREEFFIRKEKIKHVSDFDSFISAGFFDPCESYDIVQVELYKTLKLGLGEAHALSQLTLRNADIFLVDDYKGRKIARQHRCNIKGTVGLLVELEFNGFTNARESIRRLREETGFRVTDNIVNQVLKKGNLG